MRIRVATAMVIGVVAGAVAVYGTAAHAKGPSEASITGPGIDPPIDIAFDEGAGSSIVQDTGFFPAIFAEHPDPMLDAPPPGARGPRFVITWHLPGPEGRTDVVRQDLYPHAESGPLVYTAPGQQFYGSEHTHGGWYRAPYGLVTRLQQMGLPDRDDAVQADAPVVSRKVASEPAAVHPDAGDDRPWVPIGASLVLMLLAAAGITAFARRHHAMVPPT